MEEQKKRHEQNQQIRKEKEDKNIDRWRKFGDLNKGIEFDSSKQRSTLILVDDKNLDNDNKVRLISEYK